MFIEYSKISKYKQTGSGSMEDLKIANTVQLIIIKLQTIYQFIPINISQEIFDENFHVH